MATFETAAIILRAIDYGEADRVVTLFGRTCGCVSAIARAARKSQRRFGGGLGLCVVGEAALRERAGSELLVRERFDVTAGHPALALDVLGVAQAAYAAELVTKLCAPRQPEPAIFDTLLEFLALVDAEGASRGRLRVLELSLLDRLGLAPVLDACAVCGREDLSVGDDIDVRWNPERGGVVCRACGVHGRPMRPVVRLALSRYAETTLAAVAQEGTGERSRGGQVGGGGPVGGDDAGAAAGPTPRQDRASALGSAADPALRPDVANGCRDALAEVIAGHLSAPLRSLEFLAKLEAAMPPPAPSAS